MDSNIYSTELEQMREQIEILRRKLDQQKIVNSEIIKRAMKKNINKIYRGGIIQSIFGVITTLLCPLIIYKTGFPHWFVAETFIMLLFSTLVTIYFYRGITPGLLYEGNMLDTSEKIQTLKRRYHQWLYIGIPMIIIYIISMAYGAYTSELIPEEAYRPLIYGGVTGGIIGGAFGIAHHTQVQKRSSEILRQIEDIKAETRV